MSNTFNINRFWLLLKRQWLEFGKIYLISLLVVAGIIITFYAFNVPTPEGSNSYGEDRVLRMEFRIPLFLVTGFLFITIVSSNYFAHFGQKSRAMIELMIPCSTLEKFTAGILFTAFLSTLSYVLVYYLVDVSFTSYAQKAFDAVPVTKDGQAGMILIAKPFFAMYNGVYTYPFYVLPLALSSLFLLGSIYFNRFHYIKTAISVMIFSGILSFVLYKLGEFMYNGKIRVHSESMNVKESTVMACFVGVLALLTLVLWVIGYVRLKEKEV